MSNFKIATWNVNSLRVRLPHVLAWLKDVKPDILAIQETKLQDEDFPVAELHDAGYIVTFSGQRTYNGVAVLKREEPTDVIKDFPGLADPQRRVLGVTIGDVRVLNLYVPNGQSLASEKYQYKLNWLQSLDSYLKTQVGIYEKIIILGDFNIAPEELDVHDPKQWENQVLVSPPERQAFSNILNLGFVDCYRRINPTEQEFSWWDYRMNAFKRQMGLRIDHILASKSLSDSLKNCYIDKIPRAWERPSDHAPVIAEF